MIAAFFPLKKLRRNGKYFLFGAILLAGALAVYHEMIAAKAWSGYLSMNLDASSNWRRTMFDQRGRREHQSDSVEDSAAWISSYAPQTWKPEFKGQANLHVFEDWCGSSTADLRKNLHYPLYPHSRTTVQKLAVSPQWTNYGLRIFGYLHPYTNGDFVFALSSDDNSELWLSTDDSPVNLQLLAWVGKTGREWTAPGEFEKYASQTSKPVRLSAQRRYFFEVIHKQNNRGTDHVEVAWQLLDHGFRFTVIESKHISLYVDESALLMSDVAHIPQTAASHKKATTERRSTAVDMLREDPRDALYKVRLINSKFLQGVLPDCLYKPSYTIKDFPLLRYQGLQFVRMSYIYPNDYTRLTHMEKENSCFYPESPYYMRMFGFSRYMRFDRPGMQEKGNMGRDFGFQRNKSVLDEQDNSDNGAFQRKKKKRQDQIDNALFPDYGDDYDDYIQKRRRKLFALVTQETDSTHTRLYTEQPQKTQGKDTEPDIENTAEPLQSLPIKPLKQHLPENGTELKPEGPVKNGEPIKPKGKVKTAKIHKVKLSGRSVQTHPQIQVGKAKHQQAVPLDKLKSKQNQIQRYHKMNYTQIQRIKDAPLQSPDRDAALPKKNLLKKLVTRGMEHHLANIKRFTTRDVNHFKARSNQVETDPRKGLREKEIEMNMPLQQEKKRMHRAKMVDRGKGDKVWLDVGGEEGYVHNRTGSRRDSLWGQQEEFTDDEDLTPAPVFDTQVNWNQTFQVNHLDLQAQRSDWIDLRCNVSGNLLLNPSDAMPIIEAFMDRLNEKHHGLSQLFHVKSTEPVDLTWNDPAKFTSDLENICFTSTSYSIKMQLSQKYFNDKRFTLVRVANVVKRMDGVQGSRYLLELVLKDADGQLLRLSQYVYALIRSSRQPSRDFSFLRSKPQLVLCNPVGFRWNPVAMVHFVVPVKNQARWVQQLINDMEQLFRETGDANFNLIITDYNSTDMDVRKALQKSSLPRYQYVKLSGNFERSAGLQAGVDLINDDHSIVFLCDLHILFPPSIIDTVRKHCVEGHMAFAPIVLRLDCGTTLLEARGYWEVNGFGLLAIYKSDLDAIGGMNTMEFRDRWGGEDWELLDRILQAGLEVERIYLRNFFHHYHSKRGMWNRRMSASHG